MSQSDRRLNLDWVNVTYRSVVVTALLVVGIAAAAWMTWSYLQNRNSPRSLASWEIDAAESLYREAASYGNDEKLAQSRSQAREHLADARLQFDQGRYDEARVKAILSRNHSQKAIDMARSEETTRMEVRFYRIKGEVKVKRSGSLVWQAADISDPLRVGDAIKTASNGSAQIIYFEGSITTIKPGSLVVISDLVSDPTTRRVQVRESLRSGGVHSETFGFNVEGSVHEVATSNTVARAATTEKNDFEVDFDDKKQSTRLAVHEGRAEVTSGANSMTLGEQEGVQVAADGRFSAREAVLPAPRTMSPSDQKIVLAAGAGTQDMELVWSEVPEAREYRLEVARDALMAELAHEASRRGTTTVKLDDLDEGVWYWRVAAVDADGRRGRYSGVSQFRIASPESALLGDREAPNLDLTDVLQTGNLVIISGRTDSDARLWVDNQRVDVYEDGTFTAVVRLHRDGRNLLEVVAQDPAGNETVARREAFLDVF